MSACALAWTRPRADLSPRSLAERLRDHNQEVQHHIKVARLHQELYSQPFDLNGRLDQIRRDEIEKWSHLPSSQASSSIAGTPKKVSDLWPSFCVLAELAGHRFVSGDPSSSPSTTSPLKISSPTFVSTSVITMLTLSFLRSSHRPFLPCLLPHPSPTEDGQSISAPPISSRSKLRGLSPSTI